MRTLLLVLLLSVAACGSPRSEVLGTSPGSSDLTNHAAAQREAATLLSDVTLPPNAQRLSSSPGRLDGPSMGTPSVSSLVDLHHFWSVPMSFTAAVAWFNHHAPGGTLTPSGSSNGDGPGYQTAGLSYDGRSSPAWQSAELDLGMSPGQDANHSYLRADALVVWLDPRPIRDTSTGRRIHLAASSECPQSDRGLADVSNDALGLGNQLLPTAAPTGALTCRYDGSNGKPFALTKQHRVGATSAAADAHLLRALPLSHAGGGVTSCPMDDGSMGYVAFAYPAGRSIDVRVALSGCADVSNGQIVTAAGDARRMFTAPHGS